MNLKRFCGRNTASAGSAAMQSKRMSIIEAVSATATSYCVAIGSQLVIYPYFGIQITLAQNFGLAGAFTVISLVRGYLVRRAFNHIHTRGSSV